MLFSGGLSVDVIRSRGVYGGSKQEREARRKANNDNHNKPSSSVLGACNPGVQHQVLKDVQPISSGPQFVCLFVYYQQWPWIVWFCTPEFWSDRTVSKRYGAGYCSKHQGQTLLSNAEGNRQEGPAWTSETRVSQSEILPPTAWRWELAPWIFPCQRERSHRNTMINCYTLHKWIDYSTPHK